MARWFQWPYLLFQRKSNPISCIGTLNFVVNDQKTDCDSRILIFNIIITDVYHPKKIAYPHF